MKKGWFMNYGKEKMALRALNNKGMEDALLK